MEINEDLKNHFKTLNVKVSKYPNKDILEFTDLENFYDYFKKEADNWKAITIHPINQISYHFNQIIHFLNDSFSNTNLNASKNNLSQALSLASNNNYPNVHSTTQMGILIRERYKINNIQAIAICDYLNNSINQISSGEYFKGLNYAFIMTELTNLVSEKAKNIETSLSNLEEQYTKAINLLDNKSTSTQDKISGEYNVFKNEIEGWRDKTKNDTDTFLTDKKQIFENLENTYREKLRLSGPAEHWENVENYYRRRGKMWTWVSVGAGLLLMCFLSIILYKLPESFLGEQFSINTVRATLFLITIISIGIYLVRLFVKLSISAYHLSRDAKERFQLMHVYLSLLFETKTTFSESEKIIILQSLFSRADTGLLKGDSTPAMPEGFIQQILKSTSGKHG